MRLAQFVCTLTAGVALGALLVGRGLIVPAFDQHTHLLDANLAKALVGPIHLRLMEVVLAANLILATLAERWLGVRWGTTLALLGAAGAAIGRFFVVPRLYETWARADLVAGRPLERLAFADRLHTQECLLSWMCGVLLLALLLAASSSVRPTRPASPAPAPG